MLPKVEQVGIDELHEGDLVKVYIADVKDNERGPHAIISRSHPGFVRRMFEQEVPEIYDGTVEIKSIAREAGSRTKMAVLSNDESNRFALVYTLSLGSKVLYQSEKIRPGENEAWDILDACGRTCTLEIKITAWSLEDDTEQNTVTQTIDLTIPEQKADPDDAGDI